MTERLESRQRVRTLAEVQARKIEEVHRVSPEEARTRLLDLAEPIRAETIKFLVERVDLLALDQQVEALELARSASLAAIPTAAGDPRAPGAVDSFDLRAHTLRAVAEAAFRAGDLVEAERAVLRARDALGRGTLDPSLHGDICRVESAIRSDQSRFVEARKLGQRAVSLFRRAGETAKEARATLALALRWYYEGEFERALATNERGLALLRPGKDERLRLVAEFNRVYWKNDIGRHEEARAALPSLRNLAEEHGRDGDRLRLDWLDARILRNEGELERSVAIYRIVLDRALELDSSYDAAMLALELATNLLELGRVKEVFPLAETVSRYFATQGVAPEAAAALLLAAQSLREGAAADEVLRLLRSKERAVRRR